MCEGTTEKSVRVPGTNRIHDLLNAGRMFWPVADPDLEVRGWAFFLRCWNKIDLRISLALPAFPPSAFFHYYYFFFCQNKEGPAPSPTSATANQEPLVNRVVELGSSWHKVSRQHSNFQPTYYTIPSCTQQLFYVNVLRSTLHSNIQP